MSIEEKIKDYLVSVNAQFPEITSIETGYSVPKDKPMYCRVNSEDPEIIGAGAAAMQPVKQNTVITVFGKITRDDNQDTVRGNVQAASKKVQKALMGNFLNSFLCAGLSIISIEEAFSIMEKDSIFFSNIKVEGKYFQ